MRRLNINRLLKILFFGLVIKPLVLVGLGLNLRNRERLPKNGPAIIAANHNSHLDAMVLMSIYPLSKIHKVRPVAAADYFLANRFLEWLSTRVIGIVPLERRGVKDKKQLWEGCNEALDNGNILILFPEGTRGEPEQLGKLKKGLYHLVRDRSDTTVIPVAMHGLGRALPRGEALFVPFNCDIIVGEELTLPNSADEFVENLTAVYEELFKQCLTKDKGVGATL
jgi:1-acyl-sn-glycerol-3-phosphate acyltransferase